MFWFSFVRHLVALSSPERLPRRAARVWGHVSPIKLVRQFVSVLVWCSISKRAVRAHRVVFHAPDSGLMKRAEEFPV